MWSFPFIVFFQGIMTEGLVLNLLAAVRIATNKSKPTIVPVVISKARSHAGLEDPWRALCTSSACLFSDLDPGWLFMGTVPPVRDSHSITHFFETQILGNFHLVVVT